MYATGHGAAHSDDRRIEEPVMLRFADDLQVYRKRQL
jgi:hypothetical protein